MTSGSTYAIVWLDAHISLPTECKKLKSEFQTDLAPVSVAAPVDPIDEMICCIREYGASITFISDMDAALEMLETLTATGKKTILITSASLGRVIIEKIAESGLNIHSYYIFCGNIAAHTAWGVELLEQDILVQMFDFEMNLLIRLENDLSIEFIEEGKLLLANDPSSALRYFECARALAENAVVRDTPTDPTDTHRPSTKHRLILDGENGLIERARRACRERTS